MTTLVEVLRSGFLPELLAGMVVNLEIAAISLVLGVLLGVPLGLVQAGRGLGGRLASFVLGLMRAAPTFVVMFFLLNIIPYQLAPFGIDVDGRRRDLLSTLLLVAYAGGLRERNCREAVGPL